MLHFPNTQNSFVNLLIFSFNFLRGSQACVLHEKGRLLELVDAKLGSEYSKDEANLLLNVAILCTNASPSLRPAMSKVVKVLNDRAPIQLIPAHSGFSNDSNNSLRRKFWENPNEPQEISAATTFIDSSVTSSLPEYDETVSLINLSDGSTFEGEMMTKSKGQGEEDFTGDNSMAWGTLQLTRRRSYKEQ